MKPYRQISATNSAYSQIFDGRKESLAWASAAWRLSDTSDGASYVSVAANQVVPLTVFANSFARGESGSVTINVSDIR